MEPLWAVLLDCVVVHSQSTVLKAADQSKIISMDTWFSFIVRGQSLTSKVWLLTIFNPKNKLTGAQEIGELQMLPELSHSTLLNDFAWKRKTWENTSWWEMLASVSGCKELGLTWLFTTRNNSHDWDSGYYGEETFLCLLHSIAENVWGT